MTTFREALEKEIATQGISVAEVVQKSGLSKGAVYNILNGTTEESRIRVATKRALAKGCGRDLQIAPDGGVIFVSPDSDGDTPVISPPDLSSDLVVRFLSFRPFFSDHHIADAFDWLYEQEEKETLSGLQIVDRVFQRREDFLSVELHNMSDDPIRNINFEVEVVYSQDFVGNIACQIDASLPPREKVEYTLFVLAGPAYDLALRNGTFAHANGQTVGMAALPTFRFEGDQL